jgi:hypothetical protein
MIRAPRGYERFLRTVLQSDGIDKLKRVANSALAFTTKILINALGKVDEVKLTIRSQAVQWTEKV